MKDEKRRDEKAIPDNVEDYLNSLQQEILDKIEKYGWTLKFVRRPSSEESTVVIEDEDGKQVGVLEKNGAINYESGVGIRYDE